MRCITLPNFDWRREGAIGKVALVVHGDLFLTRDRHQAEKLLQKSISARFLPNRQITAGGQHAFSSWFQFDSFRFPHVILGVTIDQQRNRIDTDKIGLLVNLKRKRRL